MMQPIEDGKRIAQGRAREGQYPATRSGQDRKAPAAILKAYIASREAIWGHAI
jgi:hypothetical protein